MNKLQKGLPELSILLAGITAFGEKLSLTGFLGMVFVLSAVVLLNLKRSS